MNTTHQNRNWTYAAYALAVAALLSGAVGAAMLQATGDGHQVEMVPSSQQNYVWVNVGSGEGHLATNSSPAGAFSPDSSTLAVVHEDRVVLENLTGSSRNFNAAIVLIRE